MKNRIAALMMISFMLVPATGFLLSVDDAEAAPINTEDDSDLLMEPETTYWGFDLPHLFTIFGLTAALVLLGVVFLYVFWMKRHPESLKMINGGPDEKE